MRKTVLIALGMIAAAGAPANALLLSSNVINVTFYNGSGAGNNSTAEQPGDTPGNGLYSSTITGTGKITLNTASPFFLHSPAGNTTIRGFLTSNPNQTFSCTSGCSYLDNTISTSGYGITTLFNFSGSFGASGGGFISHDDGISLAQAGVDLTSEATSEPPTTATPDPYTGAKPGAFNLAYVSANGLPETLSTDFTIPEPASMAVLGGMLVSFGMIRRRRR